MERKKRYRRYPAGVRVSAVERMKLGGNLSELIRSHCFDERLAEWGGFALQWSHDPQFKTVSAGLDFCA